MDQSIIFAGIGQVNEGRMPGNVNDRLHSGVGGPPQSVRAGLGTLKRCQTCIEHSRAHSWGHRSFLSHQGSSSRRRGDISPRYQGSLAENTEVNRQLTARLSAHHSYRCCRGRDLGVIPRDCVRYLQPSCRMCRGFPPNVPIANAGRLT